MKISAVVSVYNEEKKIKECLESLKWADETILVDNSSTDKTVEIAEKYTSKIYTQKNDPLSIDTQKNLGIAKAMGEWILVIDADEILSEELIQEIKAVIREDDSEISGFEIPRKNIIFGKWIKHTGWYPDYQLRLFRNGKGLYEKKHVHEPLVINGKIQKLSNALIHRNYETVSQFLYKHLLIYAPNEAEELLNKGYIFDWRGAIRLPMSEFLSRYFARGGYKDGFHGFLLSVLMGIYHFGIFVYLWEKKGFCAVEDEDIFEGVKEEIKKTKKEFVFWSNTRNIEAESNIFKKTGLKLKRKINL